MDPARLQLHSLDFKVQPPKYQTAHLKKKLRLSFYAAIRRPTTKREDRRTLPRKLFFAEEKMIECPVGRRESRGGLSLNYCSTRRHPLLSIPTSQFVRHKKIFGLGTRCVIWSRLSELSEIQIALRATHLPAFGHALSENWCQIRRVIFCSPFTLCLILCLLKNPF